MIRKVIRYVWQILPPRVRQRLVRFRQPTFTVSAAVVIVNSRNEILLLDHVLRPNSGWGLPGGFVERGEQPTAAIRREIREETGIELSDLSLSHVRTSGTHVEIIFSAASDGEPEIKTREIYGFDWFAAESLPGRMPEAHLQIIDEVLRKRV